MTLLGTTAAVWDDEDRGSSTLEISGELAHDVLDQAGAGGEVRFELRRKAGTLTFRGQVERSRGSGTCDFGDLMASAIFDVDEAFLDERGTAGLRPAGLDDAPAFPIHGITPECVRELKDAGIEDPDADEVLKIRILGFDRILRKRKG